MSKYETLGHYVPDSEPGTVMYGPHWGPYRIASLPRRIAAGLIDQIPVVIASGIAFLFLSWWGNSGREPLELWQSGLILVAIFLVFCLNSVVLRFFAGFSLGGKATNTVVVEMYRIANRNGRLLMVSPPMRVLFGRAVIHYFVEIPFWLLIVIIMAVSTKRRSVADLMFGTAVVMGDDQLGEIFNMEEGVTAYGDQSILDRAEISDWDVYRA